MKRATSPDIEALRAALAVAEARADEAEARAARMVAEASNAEAIIAALKLMIEKLRRELYGQRSERKARLLDQLELQLEELEANATEDELAAEQAAAKTSTVKAFTRRRPSRKPFPEHLPRERVVVPAPAVCGCCGSDRLCKLGEDVTETLEVIPRRWKVIQTVREKFTCRDCEKISQAPAPFHVTPRGWAGPSLLGSRTAQVLCPGRHRGGSENAGEDRKARRDHLTAGVRGRAADRRPVRHRTRDQRDERRTAACRPGRAIRAGARRVGGLDARRARPAVPPRAGRQGHGLHAQAMVGL